MRRLLALADIVGLTLAFALAGAVVSAAPAADAVSKSLEMALFILSLPLWVVLAHMHGLYEGDEERSDHSTVDDVVGVFHVVTVGTWAVLILAYANPLARPSLGRLVVFWVLAIGLVSLFRATVRFIARRVTNWSLREDLRLMLLTLPSLVRSRTAY